MTTQNSTTNNTPVPAPLRHAHAVWQLLLANAKTEPIAIPLTDDIIECLVFRGSIGDVFTTAGVSKTYYSPVRKILLDCGAISILERGTIHSPSIVILNPDSPPPDELPPNVKSDPDGLTDAAEPAKLLRRVELLETRLGGFNIAEALRNIEQRLSTLESETGE